MSAVTVRPMMRGEIPAVLEIQAKSKESAQWLRSAYEDFLRTCPAVCAFIAEHERKIVGFLVARQAAGEMEILNLGVDSASRRKGIGTALLRRALSQAETNGAEKIFLEVRASNSVAQSFYRAHGFFVTGARPSYYRDPVEDALLLSATVSQALQQQSRKRA